MSVSSRFEAFISNIQLTQAQLEDAQTKHTGVRKTLHQAYYTTPFDGSTSLLVGSYGKNTEIRPPNDIDIMFVLPPAEYNRYNNLLGNKQSQLLQDVKQILLKTYSTTKMRADGQVIVVPFTSYAVEVAPAFLLTSGQYCICDTSLGGKWKTVDPKAESSALVASNKRSSGKTIHLIKMAKVWKYYCNVPLKSFAIELLSIDFLASWQYYDKTTVYYDWMIRDFFKYIVSKANSYIMTPCTYEIIWLGEEWKSRADTALARAEKACEYETEKNELLASYEWKKIFGDDFPY